jgi:hypothetical protein
VTSSIAQAGLQLAFEMSLPAPDYRLAGLVATGRTISLNLFRIVDLHQPATGVERRSVP